METTTRSIYDYMAIFGLEAIILFLIFLCLYWAFMKSIIKAGVKEAITEVLKELGMIEDDPPETEFIYKD